MGLTMGLTELFASCQFVPSAQRIGPPTGPSHLEMTPSSTSSSEAATSRTWLCVNRPNQHALFLRTPPLSRYTVTHTQLEGEGCSGSVQGGTVTVSVVLVSRPWAPAPRLLQPLLRLRSSLLGPTASSTERQFLPITSSAPVRWFPLSLDPLVLVSTTLWLIVESRLYQSCVLCAWYPRVQGLSVALAPRTSCYRNWGATDSWRQCDFKQSRPSLSSPHVENKAEFWAQLWSWI